MIKHFIVVNELSTLGAFADMIRKANYPIILDIELKDLQYPAKKLGLWKVFFLEKSGKLLSQEESFAVLEWKYVLKYSFDKYLLCIYSMHSSKH